MLLVKSKECKMEQEILPPLKAIKAYCIECCGDDSPKKCTVTRCPLYSYRLGHNPALQQKVLSDKQKANLFKKQ